MQNRCPTLKSKEMISKFLFSDESRATISFLAGKCRKRSKLERECLGIWFSEKNYESMFSFVKNITNAESLPSEQIPRLQQINATEHIQATTKNRSRIYSECAHEKKYRRKYSS